MTRLSDDDVTDEARARDAEWFEDDSPPHMVWLGAALIAASAAIVSAIAALAISAAAMVVVVKSFIVFSVIGHDHPSLRRPETAQKERIREGSAPPLRSKSPQR